MTMTNDNLTDAEYLAELACYHANTSNEERLDEISQRLARIDLCEGDPAFASRVVHLEYCIREMVNADNPASREVAMRRARHAIGRSNPTPPQEDRAVLDSAIYPPDSDYSTGYNECLDDVIRAVKKGRLLVADFRATTKNGVREVTINDQLLQNREAGQ